MRFAYVCAALFSLLAACSGDETFTDAAVGDDTPEVDASVGIDATPSGTVHVTTFARNGGAADERVANVEVLVFGLDGTMRDRDQTDTSGEAVLDVVSGDTVTAIYDLVADQQVYLTTFAGVKPGDELRFGDAPDVSDATAVGTMTINLPDLTSANSAYLVTDCETIVLANTDTTATITQTADCHGSTYSALLYTTNYDSELGESSFGGWSAVTNQTFTDAGTATMPALAAGGTFDIDLTGMSPEIDSEYDVYVDSAVGRNVTSADYTDFYSYLDPVDGAVSDSLTPFASTVDGAFLYEYLYRNGNFGEQQETRRLGPGVASLTTPPVPLPWLASTVIAVVPARTIQWFQVGTGAYDATHVNFYWSVNTPVTAKAHSSGFGLGYSSTTYFYWDVIAPPGTTALAFPELPADLAAYAPPSTTSINPQVELIDSTDVADYDAVRALPEWTITDCFDCFDAGAATTPTVRFSYAGSGGKGVVVTDKTHRPRRSHAHLHATTRK